MRNFDLQRKLKNENNPKTKQLIHKYAKIRILHKMLEKKINNLISKIKQDKEKKKSNIIETKCIETARYSNKAYFVGEYFFIFLRN